MISRRSAHLQEIARNYPLQKKVLVARSHAIGHQWLERMCRECGLASNFEAATPRSLALRFAKLQLREKGIKLAETEDVYWLVHGFMRSMAEEELDPYVPLAMLSPGIVGCFQEAVSELRQALVRSERLTADLFESAAKGEYIRKLLGRYERHLTEHRLADEAELRNYAVPDPHPQTLYITDRHLRLSAAEEEMLRAIAGDRLLALESDEPFTSEESGFPAADAEFFHALGPVAEVREVLRRLAQRRIPPDQAEIVMSDAAVYAPAVYTTALQYDIRCTYAGGIPIDFTATGQAVRLYLDWLESGYRLEPILQALKQGILRPPADDETVTTGSLIRVLEKSGIGWGRERYGLLRKIPLSVREAREGAEEARNVGDDGDDAPFAEASGSGKSSAKAAYNGASPAAGSGADAVTPAKRLADWFDGWFDVLPQEDEAWSPGAVAEGLEAMLASVPARNEDEAETQAAVRRLAETLRHATALPMDRSMAIRYVRERTERMAFGAAGIPSEGKLHVSSLQDGGQSGRPYTFIVGMDEQSWTLATGQDPVLLDEERKRIDPRLPTAKERAEREEKARAERLGAIRGSCTMSFSSFRIADKQERNAAFELLLCYRRKTGTKAAGYEELLHALPPAAGVLHSAGAIAIDAQEAWLKALIGEERTIRDGLRQVLEAYPSLRDGELAARSRTEHAEIGVYDGVFDPSGYEPVPAAASVSKLELFARCPLLYFYREILRVSPKETAEFDRSRWLDAAQRGTLLHAIFQQYWTETNEQGGKHDRARLERITEERLQIARAEIPAPSEHVMRKECENIRRDAGVFWKGELERSSRPRFMELELHRAEEPFDVELGDDLTLPLRGYVDRVDELAPHAYKILDYKTGSPRKYREDGYFAGGTQLQHAVYAAAVEQWLRRSGLDPEAKVVEAGYYFPTYRGQGHEVTRSQHRREDTARLVAGMLEAMRRGVFPPTHDPRQCAWCEFGGVCGNHAEYAKEKRSDPGNDARLSPLKEVESYA